MLHKLHIRGDIANGEHTRFTVFMNGANCGQLCMKEEEAIFFYEVIMNSTWPLKGRDKVIATGYWFRREEDI